MSLWLVVSIIAFSLSGLLFILAVSIFITDKIPAVIGDLSGRTAAKQIAELRAQNTNTGRKSHRPDMFNVERGAITDPAHQPQPAPAAYRHPSKQLGNAPVSTARQGEAASTDLMAENRVSGGLQNAPTLRPDVQYTDNGTITLDNGATFDAPAAETDLLVQGTQMLEQRDATEAGGTQVFENNEGTALMPQVWNNPATSTPNVPSAGNFSVYKNVVVVHTAEVIQ